MYTDIIHYELNKELDQEALLEICTEVHEKWMKDLDGFVSWEINHSNENHFVDLVVWESREHMTASHKKMKMMQSKLRNDWQGCYVPGSIKSKNVSQIKQFN